MQSINAFFSKHWDAMIASAFVCVVIYFLTRIGGIGISPDSVQYSSAAINLVQKKALVDFNDFPLVDFPAGYPIFLAVKYFFTGINPIQLAPFINALLYVGVIMMSSIIMQGFGQINKLSRLAVLIILACSPCLWEIYEMLWSETLFLFLILLFILAWKNYTLKLTYTALLIFAIIGACAFVTRFAGITLIATGAALILFDGKITVTKKLPHLILFIITGISFVAINLIRNYKISGTVSGVRETAIRTLSDNLMSIGNVMCSWLPLFNAAPSIGVIIFLLLVGYAIMMVLYRIIQQQFFQQYETALFIFVSIYSVFILAISSISRFEELSSRLLSPIYIPFLFIGSNWLSGLIKNKTRSMKWKTTLMYAIFFLVFLWNQYKQNSANWEGIETAGIPGFSEQQWTTSKTAAYMMAQKDSIHATIYSDTDDGLYFLTGIKSYALPHKESAEEKDFFMSHATIIVVWFNDGVNDDLINIDYIKSKKQLIETKVFDDGSIYYFVSKNL